MIEDTNPQSMDTIESTSASVENASGAAASVEKNSIDIPKNPFEAVALLPRGSTAESREGEYKESLQAVSGPSKYSQKQAKKLAANAILSSKRNIRGEAEIAHDILSAKSIRLAKRGVSNRLQISRRAENILVICEETGIVSYMDIPAIPNSGLSYNHPLSALSNARGIAQQGVEYLNALDTTVLAGILLTLSEPYALLHSQPADSAVQKNAVLRTGGKNNIIRAILFIENLVHSGNARRIPVLSLAIDADTKTTGIEGPMTEWLKLAVEAVYKPDYAEYDESKNLSERKAWIKANNKRFDSAEEVAKNAAIKKWNKARKEAKPAINAMYKAQTISLKLKTFLLAICEGDTLLTADNSLISLLISKLRDLGSATASTLATSMESARKALEDTSDPFEDSDSEATADASIDSPIPSDSTFASMPPGVYLDSVKEDIKEDTEETKVESESVPARVVPAPGSHAASSNATMSFIDRIKAKRLAESQAEALNLLASHIANPFSEGE